MEWKLIIVTLMTIGCLSCAHQERKEDVSDINSILNINIPLKEVDKSSLYYNNDNSLWTLDDELYSGYAISHYPDSSLREQFSLLNGRKQNQETRWFSDGHYQRLRNFNEGKLHGEAKTWSADSSHTLVSHLQYTSGKLHGEQKSWYVTGELFKKLNLNMGIEEGMQQAFRKNGALFANYEAKDGRSFGLKKAALCFEVQDEIIQYEK